MYTMGALRNAELVPQAYPGFISKFYIGDSVPAWVNDKLEDMPNTRTQRMFGQPEDQTSTFWRFNAGPEVEVLMPRDCDSRPESREIAAVNQWLASDKKWHIMRDHPWHDVPMLAGMFGVKDKEEIRRLSKWASIYRGADYYQTDQVFLRQYIYQFARLSLMAHDEIFHYEDDLADSKFDWPTPRVNGEFACQGYDENEQLRHPEHQLEVFYARPVTP